MATLIGLLDSLGVLIWDTFKTAKPRPQTASTIAKLDFSKKSRKHMVSAQLIVIA
jgi:hypothetical protein